MNTRRSFIAAIAITAFSLLSLGCSGGSTPQPSDGMTETESFFARQASKAIAEAQRKLETENIPVDSSTSFTIDGHRYGASRSSSDLPRAEITPQGELLVAGEPVPATPGQRELLLEHRTQIMGVAHAGMAVGAQGANIAGTALSGLGGLLLGGEEGRNAYEERVKAEAETIKQEAVKLCSLLPGLYDSQQALAAAMPEFAPYATMTRQDIDECGKDIADDATADAVADGAA